ncbi:MAG TPA: MEDS domain-containing protein [Candidatus Binatia bacterium]|nr:MEDS domain-containing protein [Candidatus Binatia bacterium]
MTSVPRQWDAVLHRPFPCDHLIQVYSDAEVLVRAAAHFIGSGLALGEGGLVIATPDHLGALCRRLTETGVAVTESQGSRGFIAVDAEDALQHLVQDGWPDRQTFRRLIRPLLDRLREAGYDRIRIFGEMVNLLWPQNHEATVRLEELWNELLRDGGVCLLCAYQIDPMEVEARRHLLHQIVRQHSHAFPESREVSRSLL